MMAPGIVDSKSTDAPGARLQGIREALLDRIWRGFLLIAILGAPASVSRAVSTGWIPLYNFHLGAALLVIVVYWNRRRISFAIRSALMLLLFWSIGLAGVFTLGFLGPAYWWLALSSLLVSTLYSLRAGIVTAVLVTAIIATAGAGFISGVLHVSVDANAYIVSPSSWANLLFGISLGIFIVFQAIATFHQSTLKLLEEVQKQRDQIEQLATHDRLTGLPSLTLADDRLLVTLNAARRSRGKVALMFIDLDGFKAVNDTYGHEAGDVVLVEVAGRLKRALRAEDTAARIGGDEFIAIVGGLRDGQVAAVLAARAIHIISQPISCAGHPITVGASVGISLFPDHAIDALSLRRAADEAMYQVKRTGKNHFAFAERSADSTLATGQAGA